MGICLRMAALAMLLLFAACGADDADDDSSSATPGQDVTYDEGSIRMQIEMLDTGLLKGHSYVDAAEGWSVEGVNVTAVIDDGTEWGVIEIREQGEADSVTFFEVQVQELPRGQQVTVTTTAFFRDAGGLSAERTAVDKWPP